MEIASDLAITHAIDAFVRGWVYSRSISTTQLQRFAEQYHVLFGLPTGGRSDEFLIFDQGHAANVYDFGVSIRQQYPQLAHWLTVFSQNSTDFAALLAPLGYRALHQETLMSCLLSQPAAFEPQPNKVQRLTAGMAIPASDEFTNPPFALDRLDDGQLGQYFIEIAGQLAAVARLITLPARIAIVDSVVTAPQFRRRGLARQLMQELLSDAITKGCQHSVLVASELGLPLYRQLGYNDQLMR